MAAPQHRTVDVAGIPVALLGDHPVFDIVAREIPAIDLTDRDEIAGTITLAGSALPPLDDSRGLGPVTVSDESIQLDFERSGLVLQFPWPPLERPFQATVYIRDRPMPYGMPPSLFRWLEPTFHRPTEAQAYAFLHLVIESMTFLGASVAPLHAAVLERDGRALALTSAGGVGKTTTAMHLLSGGRWRYLSDDMTMLQPGAEVRPYARLPMVYDYNLDHHPGARDATRGLAGTGGRLQWALTRPIHGSKRRRRVPVDLLYGRPVMAPPAKLGTVAFLVRHDRSTVEVVDLEPEELVMRSTSIIELEFQHLLDGLRLAEAASGQRLVEPLLERCRLIYDEVFSSDMGLFEIRVPSRGDAAAVGEAVELLADH